MGVCCLTCVGVLHVNENTTLVPVVCVLLTHELLLHCTSLNSVLIDPDPSSLSLLYSTVVGEWVPKPLISSGY